MRITFAVLFLLAAAPAFAQYQPEIDPEACRMMVEHQPAPDVAYQPSVDVHGKPVVEADLNPSPVVVPDVITFDITVDVAEHAGIKVPAGTEMQARIGTVTVDRQGHMTFNGQPMEGQSEVALRGLCTQKDK